MTDWQDRVHHFIHAVETRFDKIRYGLVEQFGYPDAVVIVPYNGYGTEEIFHLEGRVLQERNITPATETDSLWRNLLNTYKRINSNEVPFARLLARFQGVEQELECDEEGMFELWLEPPEPLPSDRMWYEIELELLEPEPSEEEHRVRATGKVLVPPESARYVVVSDIDDTVIQMEVGNILQMARELFLGNARTRLPFPGVAALYRAFHAGASGTAHNPLLYVSSSPWNLYDLLVEFFHLHEIPVGPVLALRNYGITEQELLPLDNYDHKLGSIRNMLDTYSRLPFILIGDSSQQDPEIYAQLVEEYPDRVLGVYIRDVTRNAKRGEEIQALAERVIEAGSALVLAEETLTMARHARDEGWIAPETLDEIRAEREADLTPEEQEPPASAAATGEPGGQVS